MAVKPGLVLRALKLQVRTPAGLAGTTIHFQPGLNVIRADNSSGKSTALQAIIYALGLEGMLGARHEVPLTHSMWERITLDGTEQPVESSLVSLEIANKAGDVVTATRRVKDELVNRSIVTVAMGAAITAPGDYEARDFFVRRAGGAQREAGFHTFFSSFVGWELPHVSRMDGSEGLLYAETLFPYFYVEQKHGWTGVQARIPTYFGIRDVGKRSAEFLMDLDAARTVLTVQRIKAAISTLEAEWGSLLQELTRVSQAAGVVLSTKPRRVSDSLGEAAAQLLVPVNDSWVALDDSLSVLKSELATIELADVPLVGAAASQLECDLRDSEHEVSACMATLSAIIEEKAELRARRSQLELRIDALREDLQRQKDARTLVALGSRLAAELLGEHSCPTCHQDVPDGIDIAAHAMTVDENIAFVDRQMKMFESALEDAARASVAVELRERAVRETLTDRRRQIRAQRDSLVATNRMPSIADVRLRVSLQEKLDRVVDNADELNSLQDRLRQIAESHREQRLKLAALNTSALSQPDADKVERLQSYLREQLSRYHFSSLAASEIDIHVDTLRPSHEGFDLGFDLSASDMIRVIWSYLLALLRVSEERDGNHLGLLIFDEPRQQDTAPESYRELLQAAAEQGSRGSQILIATSEARENLRSMLEGTENNLFDVGTHMKLLQLVKS